jgi:hypothetical protein
MKFNVSDIQINVLPFQAMMTQSCKVSKWFKIIENSRDYFIDENICCIISLEINFETLQKSKKLIRTFILRLSLFRLSNCV